MTILKHRVIEFKVYEKPLKRAIELGNKEAIRIQHASNSDDSIRKGLGAIVSVLCQIYLGAYTGWYDVNNLGGPVFDCDFLDSGKKRWELKAKDRTVEPKPHYHSTVACFNTSQKTDNYIFMSAQRQKEDPYSFHKVYLVGWLPKSEFIEKKYHGIKEEIDPMSPENDPWPFRETSYNVPLYMLNSPPDLPQSKLSYKWIDTKTAAWDIHDEAYDLFKIKRPSYAR